MFRIPLLVSVLNKQYSQMGEMLEQMEQSSAMKGDDRMFFYNRTRLIAANLKKLRRLERSYRRFSLLEAAGDSGSAGRCLAEWFMES